MGAGCSRTKNVLNGHSLFYAAIQDGTFWKERWDGVSQDTEYDIILVAICFWCLVWESIYSSILKTELLEKNEYKASCCIYC